MAGFSLLELGIVLIILTILLGGAALTISGRVEEQRRVTTTTKLAGVETAITLFVAQTQRLPCPANGTLPSTDANAGLEQRGMSGDCTGQQQNGVVPWRTLGLTEADATDGWYHRITYRAAPFLTYNNAMAMIACDVGGAQPAVTGGAPFYFVCNAACAAGTAYAACTSPLSFLEDKGLEIQSNGAVVVMNPNAVAPYQPGVATPLAPGGAAAPASGSAYVLISHGPNAVGSYSDQGTLQAASGVEGTAEAANKNPKAIPVDGTLSSFNDYQLNLANDVNYFDDILIRPSVYAVINRAQLGPKSRAP